MRGFTRRAESCHNTGTGAPAIVRGFLHAPTRHRVRVPLRGAWSRPDAGPPEPEAAAAQVVQRGRHFCLQRVHNHTMTPHIRKPVRTAVHRDRSAPPVDARLARVIAALVSEPAVTFGEGKGFGSAALKAGGRIFVFVSATGKLVAKLPADRVDEFVKRRQGQRFHAARGKPMKEWLELSDALGTSWEAVARESLRFVSRAGR
jgi:hypothetical protein